MLARRAVADREIQKRVTAHQGSVEVEHDDVGRGPAWFRRLIPGHSASVACSL